MEIKITEESKRVLEMYAKDADNWSGTPLVGGNVGGGKEERGNITQLKIAGLITTFGESDNGKVLTWITFTQQGVEYVKSEFGITLTAPSGAEGENDGTKKG